jgi:hypothetical protein
VQSCREIQREFCPLWIDAHAIVPEDAHAYLRCFPDGRNLALGFRLRGPFDSFHIDFLPLLKVLIAKSDIDITIHTHKSLPQADPTMPWVAALIQLLKNRTEQWLQYIADGDLTEVKIGFGFVASYGDVPPDQRSCYMHLYIGVRDFLAL